MRVRKIVSVSSVDKKFVDRVFSFPWGRISGQQVLESLGADLVTIRKPILEKPIKLSFDVEVSLDKDVRWIYSIGDKLYSDPKAVISIWILINIINSFVSALWIGLSFYGFALLILFFVEPYLTGLAAISFFGNFVLSGCLGGNWR